MTDEQLGQLFENSANCYADTWKQGKFTMIEGEVIQAMTKERFVQIVGELLKNIEVQGK